MVLKRWFSQCLKKDVRCLQAWLHCHYLNVRSLSLIGKEDRYNGITVDLQELPETVTNSEFGQLLAGKVFV